MNIACDISLGDVIISGSSVNCSTPATRFPPFPFDVLIAGSSATHQISLTDSVLSIGLHNVSLT
jgi:hypothetical protein